MHRCKYNKFASCNIKECDTCEAYKFYQQGRADCLKEAHRFADQESYKEGFKRGIDKGRADMLDSIIQAEKNKYYCVEDLCDESKNCSDCMVKYLEQMKEQK